MGFDDQRTLGNKEEGAKVALPIWLDVMGQILKNKPVEEFAHSPLLKSKDQVQEILANAAPERLLAPSALSPSQPSPQPVSTEPPNKEAPKPAAAPPPVSPPSGPVAKTVTTVADKP